MVKESKAEEWGNANGCGRVHVCDACGEVRDEIYEAKAAPPGRGRAGQDSHTWRKKAAQKTTSEGESGFKWLPVPNKTRQNKLVVARLRSLWRRRGGCADVSRCEGRRAESGDGDYEGTSTGEEMWLEDNMAWRG